jgi:hypothetical protein
MSAEIVDIFGGEPPAEGYSKAYVDSVHAEAFRDLEGGISSIWCASEIAQNYIQQCGTADTPANRRALEVATFAIRQLGELIELFKTDYDKRWHNEKNGEDA